jgi:hypothetical protein
VREVKVVIFFEKARNPFAGMVGWLERLSEVTFNGKQEILIRSLSSSMPGVLRLRELRELKLGNLLKMLSTNLPEKVSDNRRRLVMERNCLETRDREFK